MGNCMKTPCSVVARFLGVRVCVCACAQLSAQLKRAPPARSTAVTSPSGSPRSPYLTATAPSPSTSPVSGAGVARSPGATSHFLQLGSGMTGDAALEEEVERLMNPGLG